VWLPSVVDLRPIVAHLGEGGYHLAFQTNGGESQNFLDTIFMPPLTQDVPEAAILTAPPTDDTEVDIYPALYWTPTEGGTEIANLVDCEDSMWSGDTEWILDTTFCWKVYTMNDDQMVEGYSWSFSTDDPTVTPPFFDGFETNNVNTMPVYAWTQEAVVEVDEGYYWMGLNEYEEGMMYPRTGEWYAAAPPGGNWLFKPVDLIAGYTYRVAVFANQFGALPSEALIKIC